jgi:hypothetical protein
LLIEFPDNDNVVKKDGMDGKVLMSLLSADNVRNDDIAVQHSPNEAIWLESSVKAFNSNNFVNEHGMVLVYNPKTIPIIIDIGV